MASHDVFALSSMILLLSIVAAAFWVTSVPAVQAGTADALRRASLPGPPELLGAFLEDHGTSREKGGHTERESSRTESGDGRNAGRPIATSLYLREEEPDDRLSRNLDQIGGGNLLRRGLADRRGQPSSDRRWLTSRWNLDQIGGGNLLRETNDRGERNLDQIGGGNLVRGMDDVVFTAAADFRRNLDEIGGGNLVRNLAEAGRRLESRPIESRPRERDS